MLLLRVSGLALTAAFSLTQPVFAQEAMVWIQIEAKSNPTEALSRASAFAQTFPETQGYQLQSGWWGIVLGPYPQTQARETLANLKAGGLIPADSYITKGDEFTAQFYDNGTPRIAVEPPIIPDGEFSQEDKKAIQEALGWFGYYSGMVDGAFGAATRQSIAQWQAAQGYDATGLLTNQQSEALRSAHLDEVKTYGFAPQNDAEAGITAILPLNLVEFDSYQPPFVHYREKNGSGLRISLISKPADQSQLAEFYDIVQSLEAMPTEGPRGLSDTEFRILGQSDRHQSQAYAFHQDSAIKGWLMISSPAYQARDARILGVLQQSFTSTGQKALDPGLVALDEAARRGLVAGLEISGPKGSASGVYINASGAVVTHASVVEACAKITLDRQTEAKVIHKANGLVVLTPARSLSPLGYAKFGESSALGSQIALSGYSYGERLPAPVLTFGYLEENSGLLGETGVMRLSLEALSGDIGGPIVDGSGALLGVLLPNDSGNRQLPQAVSFAASAKVIAQELAAAGLAPEIAEAKAPLPPEALGKIASQMTALVSCWP